MNWSVLLLYSYNCVWLLDTKIWLESGVEYCRLVRMYEQGEIYMHQTWCICGHGFQGCVFVSTISVSLCKGIVRTEHVQTLLVDLLMFLLGCNPLGIMGVAFYTYTTLWADFLCVVNGLWLNVLDFGLSLIPRPCPAFCHLQCPCLSVLQVMER